MKFARIAFIGVLLHLAAATPVFNGNQDNNQIMYNEHQDPYLWQKSGKFEGDLMLTPEQQDYLSQNKQSRNGLRNPFFRWSNRRIPYKISDDFSLGEKNFIKQTLEEDFARSCVKVVPHRNERDYVYVTGKNGKCWSKVGRIGGKQTLNLNPKGCLTYSTIVHEFLHAAGFHHQHSVPERDEYVTIFMENVEEGKENNFKKHGDDVVTSFGQPYDYGSVLHYNEYSFSFNNKKTIVPKQNVEIGKASRLSEIDIIKLNKMYNC